MGIVLLLSVILDRLLLRRVTQVMKARETTIRAAVHLAESSRTKAQAASDEFDAKMQVARAEVYQQMDDTRRVALATRAELVADTRREVEHSTKEATVRLRHQADVARKELDRDADTLASNIVERVLGRKAS